MIRHIVMAIGVLILFTAPSFANMLSGYIEGEILLFPNNPRQSWQEDCSASFSIEPEYHAEWENNFAVSFVPFARFDSEDSERTHCDIRELILNWTGTNAEFRIGVGKVFWGVTEFVHLADIINQTDMVESLDGEDKLGQPMAQLSIPTDFGTYDLFLLPIFRERTFPGFKGRFRNAWVVDNDNPQYEDTAEKQHLDYALRYSHYIDNLDFGLYYFQGTNREPTLIPNPENQTLTPFYQQIFQIGMDLQLTTGPWLLKLEAIHRNGQGDAFNAFTTGLEYTISRVASTRADLGIIIEFAYDEREENATTVYQNDAMIGLRIAVNDMASTEVLAGLIKDVEDSSAIFTIEASRRIRDNWKLSLESALFTHIAENNQLYDLQDDDFFRIELAYYF